MSLTTLKETTSLVSGAEWDKELSIYPKLSINVGLERQIITIPDK